MKQPLERFDKLTLAAEEALRANDFATFRALVEARGAELTRLRPESLAGAESSLCLDARLQLAAVARMDQLRERMRQLAHAHRTARAVRALQDARRHFDVSR